MGNNPYEDMAGSVTDESSQTPAESPVQEKNPYAAAALSLSDDDHAALTTSLTQAPAVKPDAAAQAYSLSKQTGLDADLVQRNLPAVQQQAIIQSNDPKTINDETPATGAWLANPLHAQMAQDAIPSLQNVERTVQDHAVYSRAASDFMDIMGKATDAVFSLPEVDKPLAPAPVSKGYGAALTDSLGQDAFGMVGMLGKVPSGLAVAQQYLLGPLSPLTDEQARASAAQLADNPVTRGAAATQAMFQDPELRRQQGAELGALWKTDRPAAERKMASQMVGFLPWVMAGMAGGGVMAGLGGATGLQEASDASQEGLSPAGATATGLAKTAAFMIPGHVGEEIGGMLKGFGDALGEKVGPSVFSSLMGAVVKKAGAAIGGGLGMLGMNTGNTLTDYLSGKNPHAFDDFLAQSLFSFAGGAVMHLPAMMAPGEHPLASDAIHSELNKAALQDLADQHKVNPLTQTSPAAAADHLAQSLQGSTIENQLVPAGAFRKLFQDQGLDPLKAAVDLGAGDAFNEADKSGGDFKVSTARLISLHEDPNFAKLLDHVKPETNADGRTSAQVEEAAQEAQALAAEDTSVPDGAARAGEIIRQQAVAAGKSETEAAAIGKLYEERQRTRAERRGQEGVGPMELLAQRPLNIYADGQPVPVDASLEDPRVALAAHYAQGTPEEQQSALFIDRQTGVMEKAALDAMDAPDFPLHANVSVPTKWLNDKGGGYDFGNAALKNGAQALMDQHPLVAREGGDFFLRVKDQAHLNSILSKANANLPEAMKIGGGRVVSGRAFDMSGAVGETPEAAKEAHLALKIAAEKAGTRPERGAAPSAEKLAAPKGAEPVDPTNNRVDVPAELKAIHEGMSPEDAVQAANYSAKNPMVLLKKGMEKLPVRQFQAHLDLKGLGKMDRGQGDSTIKAFESLVLDYAKAHGVEVNFSRKNDNSDEYFAQHDDGKKLEKLLVDVKAGLREANIKFRNEDGEIGEASGAEFYAGIGGNHGEADRQLEIDKKLTNGTGVPEGASGGKAGELQGPWRGVSSTFDNPGSEPVQEAEKGSPAARQLKQQLELELIKNSGSMTPVHDFVADNGKLSHEAIKAAGNERGYPAKTQGNKIFHKDGMTPDAMVQRAIEGGILPAGSTEADLQAALMKEDTAKTNFIQKYGAGSEVAGKKAFRATQAQARAASVQSFSQNNAKASELGSIDSTPEGDFIKLMKRSNPSTLLHEMWHRFHFEGAQDYAYVKGLDPEKLTAGQQGIIDDHEAMLKAVGAKSWETMTNAQHEKLARWGERYMMAGESPSAELRPVFDRFRSWLVDIYKGAKRAILGPGYNPEMRGVMDRMLASTEAIKTAQDAQGGSDPFPGMENRPGYVSVLDAARAHATDVISEKAIQQFNRQQRSDWRQERDGKAAENLTRLNALPEYKALNFLQKGLGPDGKEMAVKIKLNRENPDGSKIEEADLAGLPADIFAKAGEKSYNPDAVAKIMGYEDQDALFKAIANKPPAEDLAKADANDYMKYMHGDMLTDGMMPREALDAVHNEKRAQALREEFKYIAENHLPVLKGMIRDVATRAMPAEEVQKQAASTVSSRLVGDLKPYEFLRAENAMRKESAKLFTQGDFRGSIDAKQKEILNHELYKQASDAQEQVAKITRYMKKFDKTSSSSRMGKAGEEFLKSIDFVRGQNGFDVPVADGMEHLNNLMDRMSKSGNPMLLADSVIDGTAATSIKQTPFQHLVDAYKAVKEIEHAASDENKFSKASKEADLENLQRIVKAHVEKNFGDEFVDKGANQDLNPAGMEVLYKSRREKVAWLARPMSILISADNNEANGPFYKAMWEPIMGARAAGNDMTDAFKSKFSDMVKDYSAQERVNLDLRRFKVDGLDQKFTKAQAMMVLANWGNEGNREYLTNGNKFTPENVQAFAKILDARDLGLVDAMVKHFESYRPAVKKQEMERRGVEPKWVEPAPYDVTLPDGRVHHMEGGYWPISTDVDRSSYPDDKSNIKDVGEMFGDHNARPMTEDGYTKEREKNLAQRPLSLDLSVFTNSVKDVIHDLSHRGPLMDVYKKINDPEVKAAMVRAVGLEKWQEMNPWLGREAKGLDYDPSGMASTYRWLRNTYTIASLGLNTAVPIKHVSMEIPAARELGGKYWLKGIASMANPFTFKENLERIHALSSYMAHVEDAGDANLHALADQRGMIEEPGAVSQALEKYGAGDLASKTALLGYLKNRLEMQYMIATRIIDKRTRAMTWSGAFQKAMDGQVDGIAMGAQKDAVSHADRVAMEIKGAGSAGDVPRMLTGSQGERLLYMFMSMRNVQMNQQAKAIQQAASTGRAAGGGLKGSVAMLPAAISALLFTSALPAIWNHGMTQGFAKGTKDKKRALEDIGANMLEGVPFATDMAKYIADLSAGETMGQAKITIPPLETLQDFGNVAVLFDRAYEKKHVPAFEKRSGIRVLSEITKVPGPEVFKFLEGIMDPQQESPGERAWRSTFGSRKR